MTDIVTGIIGALEKTLQSAWKFGAALILMGLAVHAGIHFGFISPAAFSNLIATYASISVAIGGALVAAASIFWIFDWLTSLRAKRAYRRENQHEGNLVYQNLRYAPNTSMLILWVALHEPNGRMPSIGSLPSMRRLIELKIMASEDAWKGYDEGAMVKVHPAIYSRKDEVISFIRQQQTDINLDEPADVGSAIRAFVRSERGW